jgi:hypothetical protein
MSIAQLQQQLATLQDNQGKGTPMTWKVLYAKRSQPLLVSPDLPGAMHAVDFFMRNPVLRLWGKMALIIDHWLPWLNLLPTIRLDLFPSSLVGEGSEACPALYIGSPGPLQKMTLYCPGSTSMNRVTKVALNPSANDAIIREAYWLRTVGESTEIAAFLPRLLDEGMLACGRSFLSMQALPHGVFSTRFDRRHRHFLKLLAHFRPELTPWVQSEAHMRLRERMQRALPLMDQQYRDLLLSALEEVEYEIGQRRLPTCLIHSDFAPWNVRLAEQHLYVFDWEYAEKSGNPIQDFLHFHLIPRVLSRWPMGVSGMPVILAEVAAYARAVYGDDSGVAESCGALAMHYLLDTLTFYTTASGYLGLTHPVVRGYLELLEKRVQWMPQSLTKPTIPHAEQQQTV